METKPNLFFKNATWKVDHEFVSPAGVITPDTGEMSFKVTANRILWKRRFIDDYGDNISLNYDIRKIDDLNYEYESDDIAEMGPQKGSIHVNRNRLYLTMQIGNNPIKGFEVIICDGDIAYSYGALYYVNTLIKTWSATMTKVVDK
ncbi:hypothetical protein AGMMS49574_09940 [Bacteroidia bacterium]|nr:hypothetical protein AGMMS49574_09940 [Bacteroidia bacterium]GHU56042.1 hypothetical protein FACS189411_05740 [Bacteroidia bacterium]